MWAAASPRTEPAPATALGGDRGAAQADARAADLAPVIAELRAAGVTTLRGIAAELNRRGIPTTSGRGWSRGAIRNHQG
jgi:hypothetical protein